MRTRLLLLFLFLFFQLILVSQEHIRFDIDGNTAFTFDSMRLKTQHPSKNVIIGDSAGYSVLYDPLISAGMRNVLIGLSAGKWSGDNSGNTLIGYQAGEFNAWNESTFIGYRAGRNNQSINNTFVGADAGLQNTDGNNNTFLGKAAGWKNTIGTVNTFVGSSAGWKNTIGSGNVFIGEKSGFVNLSGSGCTYVGTEAGYLNEQSFNTFFGSGAGVSNSGPGNTFLGFQAGNLAQDSFNIFLGYKAGFGASGGNKLYIENSASNSPLIYGEFDNDLLRINGELQIGTEYAFPLLDGGMGEVLVTDGSGYVTWQPVPNHSELIDDDQDTGIELVEGTPNDMISFSVDTKPVIGIDSTRLMFLDDRHNIAIGDSTMSTVQPDDTNNIAIGHEALVWAFESNNIAIGAGAMQFGWSPSNIAIGTGAMNGGPLTFGGIAIGDSALASTPSGGALPIGCWTNTAIGFRAMYSNVSGCSNVALGPWSLTDNTSGLSNIAIGPNALGSNTEGNSNIAIGDESLVSQAVGNNNISVGVQAMENVMDGVSNVVIGNFALENMTSGIGNTAIGFEAGAGTMTHEKSGNVFIGFKAGKLEDGDNTLYISNSDTINPLIYGEFDSTLVRINGELQVSDQYVFPTVDGINQEVLTTDGNGQVTWKQIPIPSGLVDADMDTEVELIEDTPNDMISFMVDSKPILKIDSTRIAFTNNRDNIAIGEATLGSNTMSAKNIAIGDSSLFHFDSPFQMPGNTAIGYKALFSNVTGSSNIAIGEAAMLNNNSGDNNIALGLHALKDNVNGSRNIGIGDNAISFIDGGFNNIGLGYLSMGQLQTGHENTAIGENTLGNVQNGSSNVAIGFQAGQGSSIHDKSGGVFLGYKAGFNEQGSNKLYIENSDSGSPLIYGDFDLDYLKLNADADITGRLGVGILNPVARIHASEGVVSAGYFNSSGQSSVLISETSYSGPSHIIAIKGFSAPNPGFGYGGYFEGGFAGVSGHGISVNTDGFTYGVRGLVTADPSPGFRVGVYGQASGGEINWAGYFDEGNVHIQNELRVGTIMGAEEYLVAVDGRIICEDLTIEDSDDWPDYVFEDGYHLLPLSEVETYIKRNGHLPGVPSASEIASDGIRLGESQRILLEKIEELTLHLIQKDKENDQIRNENQILLERLEALESLVRNSQ